MTPAATAPEPVPTCTALEAIVQGDAQRVGALLRTAACDKPTRQAARALLTQVWQLHVADESEVAPAAQVPSDVATVEDPIATAAQFTQLLELTRQLEAVLRKLGDDRGSAARRLQDVRIARPMPDRVAVPPSARQTANLTAAVARHFSAYVALTAARLDWFERRCTQSMPTHVAVVKQPVGEKERIDVELLRKAGKSKFS